MLANILIPDTWVSISERRNLAKPPTFSMKKLLSGEFFEGYEKYFLDQFVSRDRLRGFAALVRSNIFGQRDNKGIYRVKDGIYKMEYPLNEGAVLHAANKFNEIYDRYFQGRDVYYSVIPDKNYFMADKRGYLSLDYNLLLGILDDNLQHMNYIDIFRQLGLKDYYRTDIHWDQNKIEHIADTLLKEMGGDPHMGDVQYNRRSLYPFYGSYYGQAVLKPKPDTLIYLSDELIEDAVVYDHIDKTYNRIYVEDRFGSIDSYDLFLSGPKSMLTITNPEATVDKELIIFRDSFGSSIAPLMLKGYSRITLIDLRYLRSDLMENYMDIPQDPDVLFLYNTAILNNSYMFK
ncbi:MAG TPA: DHHW family protein [Clostridia bacterium]|nr:DHHW family protein [Clostridia bacterium]